MDIAVKHNNILLDDSRNAPFLEYNKSLFCLTAVYLLIIIGHSITA